MLTRFTEQLEEEMIHCQDWTEIEKVALIDDRLWKIQFMGSAMTQKLKNTGVGDLVEVPR